MTLSRAELKAIPKVELHRHLDGSVRFETIKDLANTYNIDLGVVNEDELVKKTKIKEPMTSLQQVLDTFWTTQKVMCNYDAIKRIAFENVEDCYLDGCVLAELRFAPVFMREGKTDLSNETVIEAVLDGVDEAIKKFPIQCGLIFIVPRSLDYDLNLQSVKDLLSIKASHSKGDLLVGFDLADTEDFAAIDSFKPMVDMARDAGLGITIHSGEHTSAAHVKKTIDTLGATRIGHGIQVINDANVIKLVKERNIHLEVCPSSNWLTKSVETLESHPLPKLIHSGVSVSINSDDPHIMNLDLVNEYEVCQKYYGLTQENFASINRDAADHSFLPLGIREKAKQLISKDLD